MHKAGNENYRRIDFEAKVIKIPVKTSPPAPLLKKERGDQTQEIGDKSSSWRKVTLISLRI